MATPIEIAETLARAARERHEVTAFTATDPAFDAELAYVAQRHVVAERVERGARVVGAKLGLTSRAKQQQMSVDSPLYGWLTSDMALTAGATLPLDRFIHPRAEPEIGFILRTTPAAPASAVSVLAATEAVFGALEIIDSRYEAFRFRLPDVIADNASSAGFVLGPVALPPAQAGDLRLTGCVLRERGRVLATAAGAAVLGHPAESVAWLCNELHRRGERLPDGAVVLSGALTDAVALSPGSVVTAEFDLLGTVEVRC